MASRIASCSGDNTPLARSVAEDSISSISSLEGFAQMSDAADSETWNPMSLVVVDVVMSDV